VPCGNSDASVNGAVANASACWPTSTSKASVYQLPAWRMTSAAWSSSATLTYRCSAAAGAVAVAGPGSGGPGALLLPIGAALRDAIGRVDTTDANAPRFSWTGTGFAAQNQRRLHFGLGKFPQIEKAVIRWPSGKTQTIDKPAAVQLHKIKEPA